MELLRGETLKRYLARAGEHGLAPDEVVSFAQQAAAALAAAHRKGIIHRDIKPANLFVLEADRGKRQIKILDFGLAKKQAGVAAADSRTFGAAGSDGQTDLTAAGPATMGLTSPGSAVGTVAYMSPEQAKGEPVDARTDLFSLGTVIYEMATGKTPFAGNSTAEVFVSLLRENPPPVSTVNPAMPRKLDAMVQKLLAKDPASRYATAEALREDLEGLNNPAVLGAKNGAAKRSQLAMDRGRNGAVVGCRRSCMVEVPACRCAGGRNQQCRKRSCGCPQGDQGLDHSGGLRQPHRRSGFRYHAEPGAAD